MRYEIKGETLPVAVCYLEEGEVMITERGSMSWMSTNMKMRPRQMAGSEKLLGGCLPVRQSSRTVTRQSGGMG